LRIDDDEKNTIHRSADHVRTATSGVRHIAADVCRRLSCSEASFYIWKKRYGDLGMAEVKELRQLRDENARLKRPVADLTLDKDILCRFT
jgi:putative transposase